MKSKTIILSQENSSGRGILTLYVEDGLLKAKLRLYQVEKLNNACKLAVYHKQQVFSANLIFKNGVYLTSLVGDWDMDDDFYTALVDIQNNNAIILSGGSYAGYFFEDNSVFDGQIDENKKSTDEKTEQVKQADCEDCEKCANCKYKQYFYANQNDDINNLSAPDDLKSEELLPNSNFDDDLIAIDNKKNIDKNQIVDNQNFNVDENLSLDDNKIFENQSFEENKINNNTSQNLKQIITQTENDPTLDDKESLDTNTKIPSILESLLPQFDYIFKNYSQNEELTKLIPNSKFVAMDENGDNYSLGAIYEDDKMKYICYAVKCNYNTPAPEELGKFYQWLPLNALDPLSEGYYIVYQDANDLKIIEV